MSACADVRALLLEAEPAELRGLGSSTAAAHVRDCAACARIASQILEDTAALDAWLGAAPDPPIEALLERAGERAGATPFRRPGPFLARHRWAALAAAAVIVAVVLVSRAGAPPGVAGPMTLATAEPPPVVAESPAGTVAVIATDNPDITVLWFF